MPTSRAHRSTLVLLLAFLAILGSSVDPAVASIEDWLFDLQIVSLERQPARDFTLQGLDGNNVSLASFRGRVVMIYFWATW